MNHTLVEMLPTRVVASDTINLAAGGTVDFRNNKPGWSRRQFVVTNVDGGVSETGYVKVQDTAGKSFCTVFAATSITLDVSSDFRVFNPTVESINVEVGEIYYDESALAQLGIHQ